MKSRFVILLVLLASVVVSSPTMASDYEVKCSGCTVRCVGNECK